MRLREPLMLLGTAAILGVGSQFTLNGCIASHGLKLNKRRQQRHHINPQHAKRPKPARVCRTRLNGSNAAVYGRFSPPPLHILRLLLTLVITLLATAMLTSGAHAARKYSRPPPPTPESFEPATINDKWKEECSACHMAFQPGLMQAEFWQNIMSNLDRHFGLDASLDEEDTKEIIAFLMANASTRWIYSPPPTRIRAAKWFQRRHDQHQNAWDDPLVKTSANCIACHKQAAGGNFRGSGGGCGGKCHSFDTF